MTLIRARGLHRPILGPGFLWQVGYSHMPLTLSQREHMGKARLLEEQLGGYSRSKRDSRPSRLWALTTLLFS